MTTFLSTERLTLRRFTDADEDLLVALHSDPDVMRYLGPPTTRDEVRGRVLPYFLGLYDTGFGYWPAIETATGEFLGWFLFRPPQVDPEPGTIELGYRLHTAAWGRGFATEGARALVDKGFAELGVEKVVADTMAVNAGSRHVMEKVGLRFVRAEHDEVFYELTRSGWSRAQRAAGPGRGDATRPR